MRIPCLVYCATQHRWRKEEDKTSASFQKMGEVESFVIQSIVDLDCSTFAIPFCSQESFWVVLQERNVMPTLTDIERKSDTFL